MNWSSSLVPEARSLLDLVEVVGGGTPSRSEPRYWGGDIPWATVKDLSETAIRNTAERITQAGLENSAANVVPAGAIVLATRIAPGRAALTKFNLAINQDLKGLLPRDGVDAAYLLQFIRSNALRIARMGAGSTVKGITLETLARVRVLLPDLTEQRRIAAGLDKADAIRRKRRESLRLLDELLPSAFVEVFGDPVKNEKGWKVVRLEERLSFLTSGSRGWSQYYSQSGRPFLRIQNIGHNRLMLRDLAYVDPPSGAETERTTVRTGDILLSITADLGRTAVVVPWLEGGYINQHVALLRTHDIEPLYLAQFLASEGGRRQFENRNRQAVKAGLNFDDIRSLLIPVPPSNLQRSFATIYRRVELAGTALQSASVVTDQLFDSIAHSAFRVTY